MEGLKVKLCAREHIPGVLAIARADNNNLGWAPKGVFVEAAKKGLMLVATDDEMVYGFVEFGGITKDKWTIYKIATAKPMRNKGIGRILVQALAEKAKESNAGLRLKVTEDNENAIAFYRKNGFEVVGVEPSKVRRLLVMEKA